LTRWAGRLLLSCGLAVAVACGGHATGAASSPYSAPSGAAAPNASAAAIPSGDWMTFDYNAQRNGVGPAATGISASNVRTLRTRVVPVPGTVDSSAIELHAISAGGRTRDVVIMTTTYGRTFALDAGTGARLWLFTPSDIGSYAGSSQITTATPVADPDRRYVYASSPDGRIHKLDVATGQEVRSGHWPVSITYDATREKIAAALNISGRSLVAVTGGYYGDAPTYQGHIVLIDRSRGQITHVFNTLCSNRHHLIDPPNSCPASASAIWGRGGAVIERGSGRILVATGNGPFDGFTNWGDSVLELSADASRLLHNWTPTDQQQLGQSDTDIGSAAPAILPRFHGYRPIVQGTKDGQLHLLNLNRLNGTTGGAGPRLGGQIEGVRPPGGGEVLTQPAVWTAHGRTLVFVANNSGTTAYRLVLAGGRPHLRVAWQNGASGTSPVLAGGLLFIYDEQGGALNVYFPGNGRRLASLGAASGHWNSPIVIGGRIILPVGNANDHNTSGTVYMFHLPGV
jgi:hypothetical protein